MQSAKGVPPYRGISKRSSRFLTKGDKGGAQPTITPHKITPQRNQIITGRRGLSLGGRSITVATTIITIATTITKITLTITILSRFVPTVRRSRSTDDVCTCRLAVGRIHTVTGSCSKLRGQAHPNRRARRNRHGENATAASSHASPSG